MAAYLAPHLDNIQEPAKSPDYLLGDITRPSESWFNDTRGCTGDEVGCWSYNVIKQCFSLFVFLVVCLFVYLFVCLFVDRHLCQFT